MEIFINSKIQNLNRRLNLVTFSNQVQVYFDCTGLKNQDQLRLYVYWLQPKKALGFKSYKELQLFCSLLTFEYWDSLNELHQIITTKNDFKSIIKALTEKDISSLISLLEIETNQAISVMQSLHQEFTSNESDFFVC